MQLYLIRHAQSANNALPEPLRVEDPGLTEMGREQAEHLGRWAVDLQLTQIYVSPFLRTLQTAEPLQRATRLKPRVRVDLHEQGGCYAGHPGSRIVGRPGMNERQILAAFAHYVLDEPIHDDGWWRSRPYESFDEATARAARLFGWTLARYAHTDERVAFVTHADFKVCFLNTFHADWLDTPYNTSVTRVDIDGEAARIVAYNQVAHLPEPLKSC